MNWLMVTARCTLYQFLSQTASCHIGKVDPVFIFSVAESFSDNSADVYLEQVSTSYISDSLFEVKFFFNLI